ncbi:unnamed protein product, partial [Closterium sp. Naga37s-1]
MAACHVKSANASSAATSAEPLASFPLHSSTWCSQAVRGIAHVAPLLHTLSLATSAVSDADVAVCVSLLTRMQVLVLDNCRKLTDALAPHLASSPSLTTISLHRCFGLTPRTVSLLLEASRKPGSVLTALAFSHVDRLSVRHVAPPDTATPSAAQSEPPQEEEGGLMSFLGLTQKREEEASFPAAISQALQRPSSLRSLSLHSCQALSARALQLIPENSLVRKSVSGAAVLASLSLWRRLKISLPALPLSLRSLSPCAPSLPALPLSLRSLSPCAPSLPALPLSLRSLSPCAPSLPALPLSLRSLSPCAPSLPALPLSLRSLSPCAPSLPALPLSLHSLSPCAPSLPALPLSLRSLSPCTPSLPALPLSLHSLSPCAPSLPALPLFLRSLSSCTPSLPALPLAALLPRRCRPAVAPFSSRSVLEAPASAFFLTPHPCLPSPLPSLSPPFPILPHAVPLPSLSPPLPVLPHAVPPCLPTPLPLSQPTIIRSVQLGEVRAGLGEVRPGAWGEGGAQRRQVQRQVRPGEARLGEVHSGAWGEGEARRRQVQRQVRPGEALGGLAVLLGRVQLVEVSFWEKGVIEDMRDAIRHLSHPPLLLDLSTDRGALIAAHISRHAAQIHARAAQGVSHAAVHAHWHLPSFEGASGQTITAQVTAAEAAAQNMAAQVTVAEAAAAETIAGQVTIAE